MQIKRGWVSAMDDIDISVSRLCEETLLMKSFAVTNSVKIVATNLCIINSLIRFVVYMQAVVFSSGM